MKRLNTPKNPRRRVLVLGYGQDESGLINVLIDAGCEVYHTADVFDRYDFDLIVSFGYRRIIPANVLDDIDCPIFNLHISFLPWNRGAHPNFWSHYDGTPAGVTIHLLDEGIDTGPIVAQTRVEFDPTERTFAATHNRLIAEIEALFERHLDDILNGSWQAHPQDGAGSFHRAADLPAEFSGWDAEIEPEIARLKREG